MSGSTIGGVVGGVIGFFVGGPAGASWGWQIGSLVGAVVDPDQIEGPRLGEARTQTAQDGVPLIYGYGTFPCAGNLAWVDAVKEHRNEESAKGGPEQITYTYTVSYMIVVCKGEISGYKIIKRNGKIVYDARTDAELSAMGYSTQEISETRAAQAAFLQRATLYYGTEDQMPDPTMVAVLGAGEVPAYTGIAYIVLKDDETREGEVSQYEFVVANCGQRTEGEAFGNARILITGSGTGSGEQFPFITSDVADGINLVGIPTSTGADIDGACCAVSEEGLWIAVGASGIRYSTDLLNTWESADTAHPTRSGRYAAHGPSGWLIQHTSGHLSSASTIPVDATEYQISAPGGATYNGANMSVFTGGKYITSYPYVGARRFLTTTNLSSEWDFHGATANSPDGVIRLIADALEVDGSIYICNWLATGGLVTVGCEIRRSVDGGDTFEDLLYTTPETGGPEPNHLAYGNGVVLAVSRDCSLVYTSADSFASGHPTGVYRSPIGDDWGNETNGRAVAFAGGLFFVIGAGGVVSSTTGLEFSDVSPYPSGFSSPRSIAAISDLSGVPIPDSPGFYVDPITGVITGPSGTQIDPCQPTLGEIVAGQCDRRSVTSRDVSELTDLVGGYRIAKPSSSQANIQGLQPGFFFGASEFDGVLHFPKRGRDLTFALTQDDFVERDGDPIQWERTQERDMLRKVTVAYVDPETTYTATTQQAERRARTIAAEGENTIELAVTGSKDWAAQVADKSIKVAWGEPDECTFHVSISHADLVTGAEGTVPYTDGQPTAIRIERIEDEGLVRMVTGRITRRDLYESNASGAAKPLPRFPGSNMRGPTDGVLMNIPVLVDQDDRPGIHWPASRMLSGWQGAQLQIRRAGEWVNLGQVTASAAMGTLLSPLPAHAGDLDTANVLHVRMNEDMESVTYVNLLQERNPLAILRDDGTAEIVQFQTASEIAPDEYELTTLLRGRLATTPDAHATGARVVFLDERVQYATLEPTDIGTTLQYRFVSLGTDPDAAPIQTMELTTMESQMEWPVDWVQVAQDGDDYTVTWLARDRLGNDVFPVRSANWTGYEVSYSHSGGSGSVVVTTESHTFTLPGASDITFSVAQLNQYTGAGPAQTVTVP